MSLAIVAISSLAIPGASQLITADRARHDANVANDKQAALAKKNMQMQDEALNAVNSKKPNLLAIMAANGRRAGNADTFLTGPSGVSTGQDTLGRQTLLGG
jgi:hypothetical protein